ncbi:agmatine deiminase family protein [Rhodovibrionaceae bacterium A322]
MTQHRRPFKDGFFMPAEWAPHRRCWMAWPCREETWGEDLDEARDAYAEVASAIARFEPVTMIANPENVAEVSIRCGNGVGTLSLGHDDSWARDNAPTFLIDGAGNVAGVDWVFNAWGEIYHPYDQDAAMAAEMIKHVGADHYPTPLVTEGGAIHTDGEGTLLVVEPSIVNDNRNPGMSRQEIEEELMAFTGTEKVIWLPFGIHDDETDGHVDNVACFVRPGEVMIQAFEELGDLNHANYRSNLAVLEAATDAKGRAFNIIKLPAPKPRKRNNGDWLALSYINFYLPNGGVIMPSFDDDSADNKAFDILCKAFPDREVVQIRALPILEGGGGIHCITQQEPTGILENVD